MVSAQSIDLGREIMECKSKTAENCVEWLKGRINELKEQQPDSVSYRSLLKASGEMINPGYFDLGAICARNALKIASSTRNEAKEARAAARLSAIYVYDGRLDSAEYYMIRAREIYQSLGDSFKEAVSILNHGQIQKEMGLYELGMANYLDAMQRLEALGESKYVAHVENEIATLYAMTEEVEKAVEFGLKAARTFEESGDVHNLAYAKLNVANNLIYLSREDTAIIILKEVIPVFEEEENTYMIMNAHAQYGRALYRINRVDEALNQFNISNSLDPDENFVSQLAYNHEYLSRIFRGTGEPALALYHSRKSLKYHKQLGWNEEYKDALHDLAMNHEALAQPDSALKYYKVFISVSDSLSSITKTAQLNELKARYESDLKEQQLKSSEAEIVLLQDKNRSKSQRNTALIVAILAITGLAGSIIIQQRRAYRLTRELAEENQRSLKAELKAEKEEQERLQAELDYKKRNLASQALLIAEKNEMFQSFKGELESLPKDLSSNSELSGIVNRMDKAGSQTRDWDKFMAIFNEVHPDFHDRLRAKYSQLSANDLRLSSLIKMNFSNKEMASILHISEAGLKKARYRLRKKMELEPESDIAQHIHRI